MFRIIILTVILVSTPILAEEKNAINVGVCSLLPFSLVSQSLNTESYSVKIINVPKFVKSKSECEAIWVGVDVPLESAKEVIDKSISSGITLRYIGIHGDYDFKRPPDEINRTITIGASTRAAIDQGLKKLDKNELISLLASKSEEEFHEKIRNTYSIISMRNWVHKIRD